MPLQTLVYTLKWSVSRGRDTAGYNVATALDARGNRVAQCKGGGYDMRATVMADALEKSAFAPRMLELAARASRRYKRNPAGAFDALPGPAHHRSGLFDDERILYGLVAYFDESDTAIRVSFDGGCGAGSLETLCTAMGVDVSYLTNKRGRVTGFVFTDVRL